MLTQSNREAERTPLYAICPYCGKNVVFKDASFLEGSCMLCGGRLTSALLEEKEAYIDIKASNSEYAEGKLYFDNTDFREAGEHYKKSLKYNPNNYLANYYAGLCDVYENEENEEYDIVKNVVKTIVTSLEKMENSLVELKYRIAFLTPALNEIYIIILSRYNRICERYDNPQNRPAFRYYGVRFLAALNKLFSIDRERLLVYEKTIASSLLGLTDLALAAAFRINKTYLDGIDNVDSLSDVDFNRINGYYKNFIAYALELDKKFNMQAHTTDYSECLQFNKEVLLLVDNYYTLNRDNSKNFLSLTGELLTNMNRQCKTAVKLTHMTCFRALGFQKDDPARIAVLNQAIAMSCELLLPRLYIDGNRRVELGYRDLMSLKEITDFLDAFLFALPDNAKRSAADTLNHFYDELNESLGLYFSIVIKNYSKFVNKLKRSQNDEFRYYQNFLFKTASSAAVGSPGLLSFTSHKLKQRINLLKLCKQICEEFLLLCDYKIDEIEKSQRFKDILKIFSSLDNDIHYLVKLR